MLHSDNLGFPGKASELSEVILGREKCGNLQERKGNDILLVTNKEKITLDLSERLARKMAEKPIRKEKWELKDGWEK